MLLTPEWSERFIKACERLKSARRRTVASGEVIYSSAPEGRCWAVAVGYVKVLDPRLDGSRSIRLILGRGGLFGDRPFGLASFRGFISPQQEQSIAHGHAEIIEMERGELEVASRGDAVFASMLLESMTSRTQFLERRLLWQFTTPIRARIAATLRDLICYEGQRCKHGHTIDVRLSHQDLSELVGASRPVISAEVARMKREGLLEYTRCYFCVDDLAGLDRIATA
ncbi:Crp/Fnr family transcriptional regulator [Singulisphaera sp. PoT]|uniref:Crp/Fnr family transcriptional regulator n=1 Tax=Singulisphaera sp. PoT TaxID=3411797 RepID=UPI003BF4DFF8